MLIINQEKNLNDYYNFLNKFIEKYDLDNILQKDLNYGFYFQFSLQFYKIDRSLLNEKVFYYYLEHDYLLKVINIILEILGFKSLVKDYIIFFNYKYEKDILGLEKNKYFNVYRDNFRLCICFKKQEDISFIDEKNSVFKLSEVGFLHRDNYSKPGNFYTCLEDMFHRLINEMNKEFLGMKMSNDELFKYLFNIYKELREEYYDKNEYYEVRGLDDRLDHIFCFRYDNRYNNSIIEDSVYNNGGNIWEIYNNNKLLKIIGDLFVNYSVPLIGGVYIDNLDRYQYGLMKGCGSYEYLDFYTRIPYLRFYDQNVNLFKDKDFIDEKFEILNKDFFFLEKNVKKEDEYLKFSDYFVKKYELDYLFQNNLNYCIYINFRLQSIKFYYGDLNNDKIYYNLKYDYILKVINILLEILGFKLQIKDFIIFLNYKKFLEEELIENKKFYNHVYDEFGLFICFKKDDQFLEKKKLENSIFKLDYSPGNFFKVLEQFFYALSLDQNKEFLSMEMKDEDLYKYLLNIYIRVKDYDIDNIDKNRISLQYFKYDNNLVEKKGNRINGWEIKDYMIFYQYIGKIFHYYIVPLIGRESFDKLGKYQYGLMKGYGNYEYLDFYTRIPYLSYYYGFTDYSFKEINWSEKLLEE